MENPLSKADLAKMKESLYKLNKCGPYLDLLEKAGYDVSELKAQCQLKTHILNTLRTELWPTTP